MPGWNQSREGQVFFHSVGPALVEELRGEEAYLRILDQSVRMSAWIIRPSELMGRQILSPMIGWFMSTNVLATNVLSEEERLETMLLRRLGNRIRDLRVVVLPNGLILQGRTGTYHAKQIA